MVDNNKDMLPEDYDDINKEDLDIGNLADDQIFDEDLSDSESIDERFQFEEGQKVYWTEEQENAVSTYLEMSEVWYENRIAWELEEAKKKKREPNNFLIADWKECADRNRDPKIANSRDRIFRDKIDKPLKKLVENIVFTYKLVREDIDIRSSQDDCLGFVMEKFANFKPYNGTKAYSYYGTIVKHYLIGEKKKLYSSQTKNLDYESYMEEVNNTNFYEIGKKNHLEESYEFFSYVIDLIKREMAQNAAFTVNDISVGNALIAIFERHEDIQLYKKSDLYQLIKEFTDLETKDITYSLSRYKTIFRINKKIFFNNNDDNNFNLDIYN